MRRDTPMLLDSSPRTFDVVCAGEALWDLTATGTRSPASTEMRFRPSGGAVTAAAMLARSGLRVGLATSLADDTFGRELKSRIASSGVDVGGVVLAAPRTGIVLLEGVGAVRQVVSYRDEEQPVVVPASWSSAVVFLSGLSPVVANAASLCKAARAARRVGTIVLVDVRARFHLWAGRDARAIHMVLREADVVHVRTDDLAALGVDIRAVRATLRAQAVLVVSGPSGDAWAVGPFGELGRPPATGTLAARTGDAFTVSLCAEIARSGRAFEHRADFWDQALRSAQAAEAADQKTSTPQSFTGVRFG